MSKKIRMTGRSKMPPKSDVRQGPAEKKSFTSPEPQISLDPPPSAEVNLVESTSSTPLQGDQHMTFTHVTTGKSNLVRYSATGLRGLIRISPTLLSGSAPATLESLNDLPWAAPKAGRTTGPRVKMTAEEKAAAKRARAALTPEQIVAEAQARAQKTVELAQARAAKAAKKLIAA